MLKGLPTWYKLLLPLTAWNPRRWLFSLIAEVTRISLVRSGGEKKKTQQKKKKGSIGCFLLLKKVTSNASLAPYLFSLPPRRAV